uniref:AB hydrolase-1 domain-containing protein n=1 Tax=Ciona savignyi TaxID=51511 RepID=H2ZBC3_CIOSA
IEENHNNADTSDHRKWFDFLNWFHWKPISQENLIESEKKMLSTVKCDLKTQNVGISDENSLWTVTCKNESNKTPLVLVHGFAGGVGLWSRNYDELCKDRSVYAFDLLGFGRSSRPCFGTDPEDIEKKFIDSIEEWRQEVGIKDFILLGHSFGGYLACCYTMKYPSQVKSLILADPWGFPISETELTKSTSAIKCTPWHNKLWVQDMVSVSSLFNPLGAIRSAGPWGPTILKKYRQDFKHRFPEVSVIDENAVFEYIYQCNAQNPTGEIGFRNMNRNLGYAYRPMLARICGISTNIPITFIYGKESWIISESGEKAKALMPNHNVRVYLIDNASHNVHADQPAAFNRIVCNLCTEID